MKNTNQDLNRVTELFLQAQKANAALCDLADAGNRESLMGVALLARELTTRLQTMQKVEANLPALREIAEMVPNWPMLVALHGDANNHFPLALSSLNLGSQCPIHTGESNSKIRIKYSLNTPVNHFVWDILHKHDALRLLAVSWRKIGFTQAEYEEFLPKWGFDKSSLTLPKLCKRNASAWADQVVMPHIKAKYPDARIIPCFTNLDLGPTGQRYSPIRTAVIKALKSMAE